MNQLLPRNTVALPALVTATGDRVGSVTPARTSLRAATRVLDRGGAVYVGSPEAPEAIDMLVSNAHVRRFIAVAGALRLAVDQPAWTSCAR